MNINKRTDEFIRWAHKNSWSIVEKSGSQLDLNSSMVARYTEIPNEYIRFLNVVKKCVTPHEQTWFNCEYEFNNSSNIAFKWNEYELLSLEAAGNNSIWRSEITAWWDHYLPIVMSVDGGYSYYAIQLPSGAIVRGYEPEFEEIDIVADTFGDFLALIMAGSVDFTL